MAALLENNQVADGIDIPSCLHKYTGFTKIQKKDKPSTMKKRFFLLFFFDVMFRPKKGRPIGEIENASRQTTYEPK